MWILLVLAFCWPSLAFCASDKPILPTKAQLAVGANPYKGLRQVDPKRNGAWIYYGYAGVQASAMALQPNTDRLLLVDFLTNNYRPSGIRPPAKNLGYWRLDTNTYSDIDGVWPNLSCGGYAATPNGTIVLFAGHVAANGFPEALNELNNVYSSGKTLKNRPLPDLKKKRWYPSIVSLADGQLMAFQGAPSVYGRICSPVWSAEIYSPYNGSTWVTPVPKIFRVDRGGCYSGVFLMPRTGHVIAFDHKAAGIFVPGTDRLLAQLPPYPKEYNSLAFVFPYSGTFVMFNTPSKGPNEDLPLDFGIFGGTKNNAKPNTRATRNILRIRITITPKGGYKVGKWELDDLVIPRVMGDSVLLPNGKVIIINGAQQGYSEQQLNKSNIPVMTPQLYSPGARKGKRMRNLQRTTIPRMYHSTATLTPAGDVVVGGCTTCYANSFNYDTKPISFSPYRTEYRIERFYPPFWFFERPVWVKVPKKMSYAKTYSFEYRANLPLVKVVLHRPGSVTHAVTMDRFNRELYFRESRPLKATYDIKKVRAARMNMVWDRTWAPAGYYLLYLVQKDDTYSKGTWVYVG